MSNPIPPIPPINNTAFIPPYVPPYGPVPNITPFTYRDGQTYLQILEGLRVYINQTVVPFIDDNLDTLGEIFVEEVNRLIEAVNQAIDLIINDSIEVQDPVVAALVADTESLTRQALDVAFYPRTEADETFETKAHATATFETKADATAAHDALAEHDAASDVVDEGLQDQIDNHTTQLTSINDTINNGRLSEAALDSTYVSIEPTPIAVFIGSSNSVQGTWTENFCNLMGYINKNYSIGGGAFTQTGPSQFIAQINNAIADTTYNHAEVKFVFVCDMGNDIRGQADVSSTAPAVFSAARTAYPNARIILLPALWGNATDNLNPSRIMSISKRVTEAVNAGLLYGVELVDYSWTWHMDSSSWMEATGGVHYNVNGYARIAQFMKQWMITGNAKYDQPARFVTPLTGVSADYSYWTISREGNIATLQGIFEVSGALSIDFDLGQIGYGYWPMDSVYSTVISNGARAGRAISIYTNGLIRTFSALEVGAYHTLASWRVA
jgi:hypothetical protein